MSKNRRLAFFNALEMPAENPRMDGEERVPPAEMLLVKFGKNTYTKDGAEGEFEFSETDADAVIGEFQGRGRDVVIDYEHQTLGGGRSPAAGWINGLVKSAEGLVARVRYWTRQAEGHLSAGEYRYVSPVLQFSRRARTVVGLHSAALTNHPALHGMPALVADDAAGGDLTGEDEDNNTTKGVKMEKLVETLGLGDLGGLSDDEASVKVREEVERLVDGKKRLEEFLKLHDCETLDGLEEVLKTLLPSAERERLEGRVRKLEAESEVARAFSDGKLTEGLRKWALDFAERDMEAFKDWAKSAPQTTPLEKPEEDEDDGIFDEDISESGRKILRNLGISDEQIDELVKGRKK